MLIYLRLFVERMRWVLSLLLGAIMLSAVGCAVSEPVPEPSSTSDNEIVIEQDVMPVEENNNLCQAIYDIPIYASVRCDQSGCYLSVRGDERVTYRYFDSVKRQGMDVGSLTSAELQSGDEVKLIEDEFTEIQEVVIDPYDPMEHEACLSKRIRILRDQFSNLEVFTNALEEQQKTCFMKNPEYTVELVSVDEANTKVRICNKESQEIAVQYQICRYDNCGDNKIAPQTIAPSSCKDSLGVIVAPKNAVKLKDITSQRIEVCE